MPIAKKIENQLSQSSWIRKMFEEGGRLKALHGADKVYDFTLGNPTDEPPQAFHKTLKEIANAPVPGMHRYMSNAGYPETRAAIAKVLQEDSGEDLTAEHVIMTVGAGGGLNVIFKAILDQDDEVIISAPFFVEYKFYITNHGGLPVVVQSREDFQLDLEAIEKAITDKTKAIIINSPNNPTGVVYNSDSLDKLHELVERKGAQYGRTIYVISDEPYAKIVYDDVKVPPVLGHIRNSIVVTSHSKDLALPGERIGYIAVNPQIDQVALLVDGLVFCNRILGFVNAPALMQRLVAGLQRETVDVQAYQERRDMLYNHLTSIGFEMVKPDGAFYLFPKSPLEKDIDFVEAAQKHNILLVPGSGFGQPGYFRISYCVDKEMIERSLPAFTALAKELGLTS
ncbi:pyridoxal phosphate-dependent aminotransferase [Heliorestis acidaminivorans]|uniref:Pyridoxal phosphate-dependent aminotransferase n=1 Tax=Heliorestis acidaminivorans TaxID=553427 RepID=A0A6I0F194_9FIRM|nr:pyridoxal phosphate-dependent aminotransferase [Heliorestis acidaminivorans]KAB2951929.1 pyridoxal phosphate-dependent aminotransferase [Heliorestis acidaminivorans]